MRNRNIEVNCTKCGHLYTGTNPTEAVRILHQHGTETKHTTRLISKKSATTTITTHGGTDHGRNLPN